VCGTADRKRTNAKGDGVPSSALRLRPLVEEPQTPLRTHRWLCLYLKEHERATLEDVALLVSNLRSLATRTDHARALAILRKAARRG
jgi:hypothetical protein